MKYVLYNPETSHFIGNREWSIVDGKFKDVHQFFNEAEIDFLGDMIKDGTIPESKDDWIDDWQRVHNVYIEIRDNMRDWWCMLYDEEKRSIVHTSNCNFRLEEKPEGAG